VWAPVFAAAPCTWHLAEVGPVLQGGEFILARGRGRSPSRPIPRRPTAVRWDCPFGPAVAETIDNLWEQERVPRSDAGSACDTSRIAASSCVAGLGQDSTLARFVSELAGRQAEGREVRPSFPPLTLPSHRLAGCILPPPIVANGDAAELLAGARAARAAERPGDFDRCTCTSGWRRRERTAAPVRRSCRSAHRGDTPQRQPRHPDSEAIEAADARNAGGGSRPDTGGRATGRHRTGPTAPRCGVPDGGWIANEWECPSIMTGEDGDWGRAARPADPCRSA
jgi:hypothetical protein